MTGRVAVPPSRTVAEGVADRVEVYRERWVLRPGADVAETVSQGAAPAPSLGEVEIRMRWRDPGAELPVPIRGPADIAGIVATRLEGLPHEELWALYLDVRLRPIGTLMVSRGGLTGSMCHPREILAPALTLRADALALAHNHPSGDATPSVEDIEVTERIGDAARILGGRLLDHVVVADGGRWASLHEMGVGGLS